MSSIYSMRFSDGCIFQDNIKSYFIEMNQQILSRPLFWLEIEEDMGPMDCTSHDEWESCKNVKQHAKYGNYGPYDFAELYLYENEKRVSDDPWYLHKITFQSCEENKVKLIHLYGSEQSEHV